MRQDWNVAISRAESEKDKEAAAEAEVAEKKRLAEMAKLAAELRERAREFTSALLATTKAGDAVKAAIQKLLERATLEERRALDNLFRPGPYMRAAQNAGLRSHLEFAPYFGPKEHLKPLEDAFAPELERWLQPKNGKEK